MTTYQEIRRQIESLTLDEQMQLMQELASIVSHRTPAKSKRNIIELEGLGKNIWRGIDAQEICSSRTSIMEWLNSLTGKIVGLDTAPLIYFIEQNPKYITTVREFFSSVNRGEFRVITSTLTLTEVLVHPLRNGNIKLAQQYQDILLNQDYLIVFSVSSKIAKLAAELRATKNLRTPDAI